MTTNQSAWNLTTTEMSTEAENSTAEAGRNRFRHHPNMHFLDNGTFVIGSVGSLANGFVLLALLCARQSRRKKINVFIIHQSLLDLLACLFLILTIVSDMFQATSATGSWIVCLVLKSNTLVAVVSYSSIAGLVVITAERYVKIVHPVVYRNRYRPWMTYAGVILPWVDGVCTYLIPAWSTAALIDGRCWRFMWPTQAMYSAYTMTMFIWHYVAPPTFFFFAYSRIIGVIRRQNRTVGTAETTGSTLASCSTQVTGAGATGRRQKHHSSQLNVVRTMMIIVLCFCICYLPYKVYDTSPPFSLNIVLNSSSVVSPAGDSASNVRLAVTLHLLSLSEPVLNPLSGTVSALQL